MLNLRSPFQVPNRISSEMYLFIFPNQCLIKFFCVLIVQKMLNSNIFTSSLKLFDPYCDSLTEIAFYFFTKYFFVTKETNCALRGNNFNLYNQWKAADEVRMGTLIKSIHRWVFSRLDKTESMNLSAETSGESNTDAYKNLFGLVWSFEMSKLN